MGNAQVASSCSKDKREKAKITDIELREKEKESERELESNKRVESPFVRASLLQVLRVGFKKIYCNSECELYTIHE